jgi:hypothetical protein
MTFLAFLAVFVFAWSLVPGLGEMLIAAAPFAALRYENALAGLVEVGDGCAGLRVIDERADGDLQDRVRAGMAAAIRAFAVASAIAAKFAIVTVAQQRVVVRIRFYKNAAAVAAIAAGRAAPGDVLLAAEGHATVAAVACLDQNFGFVYKHREESYSNSTGGGACL